ncbi:MAG: hypothetical protein E6Q97_26590 [Desulfurellales bacterium]|nr:MAG: hypothetical protein E6Q97_26590 [Desulfurellales bacterium]
MNLLDEIFSDAQTPVAVPSDDSLRRVAVLAAKQRRIEEEINTLETALKNKKEELAQVQGKELPELMTELTLRLFELDDGYRVEIGVEYYASISKEKAEEAHAWLRSHNYGDLIKNNIILSLGKGEDKKAEKIEAWCVKQKLDYERKEQVHPMTLKAFVAEQLKKGVDIPHDLLGVHVANVAKIKPPKAEKKGASK